MGCLGDVTLAIAVIPDVVTLPEPDGVVVVDRASYRPDVGDGGEVALPHAIYTDISQNPDVVRYLIDFDVPAAISGKGLFIFIPSINRRISLTIDGKALLDSSPTLSGSAPLASTSIMTQLLHLERTAGRHQLTLTIETGQFIPPIYLSRIYLGPEAALAPHYKLRTFLGEQLKIMASAAHVLLGLGLIFAYFFRPNDPLFSWLATLNVVGIAVGVGMLIGFQPALQDILPFIVILTLAMGFLLVGVALALINVPPPKFLREAVAAPCLFCLAPLSVRRWPE